MGASPAENDEGVTFSQLHALAVADLNADTKPDVVVANKRGVFAFRQK